MSVPTAIILEGCASDPRPERCTDVKPPRPWQWSQIWRDVFFAHWRIAPHNLRPHLPKCLALDIWEDTAWISAVAFRLDVKHRWLPSFGLTSGFVELNLRTYVRFRGEPGIFFLSIHAGSPIAVALARLLTPLPYVNACLSYRRANERWQLKSHIARGSDETPLFAADFVLQDASTALSQDPQDVWLLERYRAFVPDRGGQILRMVVHHPTWSAQHVDAKIHSNKLGAPWGLDLSGPPDAVHFAAHMPAQILPFEKFAIDLNKC